MVGLSRPHSNFKTLSGIVNDIKSSTPGEFDAGNKLIDSSYSPEITVKSLIQQHKHGFSNNEIAEMARQYRAGKTIYELAKEFGCHRVTVSAILKRNGITVSVEKSEKMFDPAKAAELYEAGMKSKDIGIRFGVSEQTIRKCLKKQGIRIRTRWDYAKMKSV